MKTIQDEIKYLKKHLKELKKRNLGSDLHRSVLIALIKRKERKLGGVKC